MKPPVLYMMFGYPGAGKTTTAEYLAEITDAVHISSDKTRLELFHPPVFDQTEHDELYRQLNQRTHDLLQAGQSVIYDANLNRRQHRQEKYDICRDTGATPILLWIQTPRDIAKQRATDTERSNLVPQGESLAEMFDRIADIVEEPGNDEPYIAIDGTVVTPESLRKLLQVNSAA